MIDFQEIGKYKITAKLGQGSFGVVYQGRDAYLKRDVAIKVCSVEDSGLRQRFFREAEISGKLVHKNIVTVYEFGFEGEIPYLVQEMLSGEDLSPIVKRRAPLLPADKLDYLLQIATGLGYAHTQGVIHRDIKPGNVRVLEEGKVKIMDFGIAKLASAETQLTQKGVTMGTASYLPPEQVRGGELDHRADIFSFGVLAYELLTYQRPFRGNTLSALVYQILYKVPQSMEEAWPESPGPLARVIAKCLEKKPERRYESFGELIPELTAIRDEITTGKWPALSAAPASLPGPVQPPPTEPSDVLSPTIISRTAQGVLEGKVGEATISTAASAQDVLHPPAGGAIGRSTQPIAAQPTEPQQGIASAAPPAPTEDESLRTRIMPALPDSPDELQGDLTSTARQISDLVAQGQLEAAKEQLEATINRQDLTGISAVLAAEEPETTPSVKPSAINVENAVASDDSVAAKPPPPLPVTPPQQSETASSLENVEIPRNAPGEASAAISSDTYRTVIRPPFKRFKWLGAAVGLVAVGLLTWLFATRDAEPVAVVEAPPSPTPVATTAPRVEPTLGAVTVYAAPWAEVTEITDSEGYVQELPDLPQTPLYLELPPGQYMIQLKDPAAGELLTCDLEVTPSTVANCRPELPEVSVTDYFKDSGWWP